jgi:antitoxin component of RelBE/YafQ-DinJ toxin-antitoxin module
MMTSLTIAVDKEVLLRARVRALRANTSVNALLRIALKRIADGAPLPGEGDEPTADQTHFQRMLEVAERIRAAQPADAPRRRFTREELYSERMDRWDSHIAASAARQTKASQ